MGIVLALAVGGAAWGAGQRDKGFGKNGLTLLDDPGGKFDLLTDLALLPNGKILAVGARDSSAGFLVARFRADGRPDRSFDGDGINVQPYNGGALEPRGLEAMDVDSKGRFVAAGLASGPGAGFDAFGITRYRRDGLPDTAFGDGGVKIVQPLDFGQAHDVDTGPGDKVVAVGHAGTIIGGGSSIAVLRLTARGQLDPMFGSGGGGGQIFDLPGSDEQANVVKVLPNGSIVLAGDASGGALIGKLDSTGEPVGGFGTGGFTVEDVGRHASPSGTVYDIASGGKGRFVVVGEASSADVNADQILFAARFKANGNLDPSFGDGGVFRSDRTTNDDIGFAVAAQPDGRIVIAGVTDAKDNGGNTWLVRLTARGRLDPTFGRRGQVILPAGPNYDEAMGVALQPDGRIVVAGDAGVSPTDSRLMVARFRGDPPCFGRAATITGTSRRDTLNGTPGRDVISSLGGADTLNGRGGPT